jgi:hypothetical protein
VLLRETGMSLSSDDLRLVRDEVVYSDMLSDERKKHVSVFSAFAPSHFSASHSRTVAKSEASIDTVATHLLADIYVVYAYVTVRGQSFTPAYNDNVK